MMWRYLLPIFPSNGPHAWPTVKKWVPSVPFHLIQHNVCIYNRLKILSTVLYLINPVCSSIMVSAPYVCGELQAAAFSQNSRLEASHTSDLSPCHQAVDIICAFIWEYRLQVAECLETEKNTMLLHLQIEVLRLALLRYWEQANDSPAIIENPQAWSNHAHVNVIWCLNQEETAIQAKVNFLNRQCCVFKTNCDKINKWWVAVF